MKKYNQATRIMQTLCVNVQLLRIRSEVLKTCRNIVLQRFVSAMKFNPYTTIVAGVILGFPYSLLSLVFSLSGGVVGGKIINKLAADVDWQDNDIPMWLVTLIKFFGGN